MIYLDTSVIVPFYLPEILSETVEQLFRTEIQLGLSQLVEVELFSALSRRVRMGQISQVDAQSIVERFRADRLAGFYTLLSIEPVHFNLAQGWISRFDTTLRTLDALHLAIAAANNLRLVTADEALGKSAEIIGLEVQILRIIVD